jgi:hypothetical protein
MATKSKDIILYIDNPKTTATEALSNENQLIPRYKPRKIIYPPRNSKFMTFYDMGLLLQGGEQVDRPFVSPSDTVINGINVTQAEDLDSVLMAQRNAALLAVPLNEFESTFPLIVRDISAEYALNLTIGNGAAAYRETIIYNNERWKNDQLNFADLPLDERFRIIGAPFFATTILGGDFPDKVTSLPFFGSVDISSTFVLKKDAKIFLTPAYCNPKHDTRRKLPDQPPQYYNEILNETLFVDYQTYPRIFFRNNALINLYPPERFIFGQERYQEEFDFVKYNNFRQSAEFLRNQANAVMHYKEYRVEFFEGNFLRRADIFDQRAGNLFTPDPPFVLPDPNGEGTEVPGDSWFSYEAQWNTKTQSGLLLAIIKQGGNAYYVWER